MRRITVMARTTIQAKYAYALMRSKTPTPGVSFSSSPRIATDADAFLASMVDLAGEGKTILVSSHSVAELERVASHAAFLAGGRVVLAGPLDELRRRLVRLRLRFAEHPPDAARLGTVLDQQASGRQWQALLQDPDVVEAALAHFMKRSVLGFSDCLILEVSRKAGHLPLGSFDRDLAKLEGVDRI